MTPAMVFIVVISLVYAGIVLGYWASSRDHRTQMWRNVWRRARREALTKR